MSDEDRLTRLVPRMREHGVSVFAEMSALATRVGAINLGQGFPDTEGPELVKQTDQSADHEPHFSQSAPSILQSVQLRLSLT